jgi:hypothetical protein
MSYAPMRFPPILHFTSNTSQTPLAGRRAVRGRRARHAARGGSRADGSDRRQRGREAAQDARRSVGRGAHAAERGMHCEVLVEFICMLFSRFQFLVLARFHLNFHFCIFSYPLPIPSPQMIVIRSTPSPPSLVPVRFSRVSDSPRRCCRCPRARCPVGGACVSRWRPRCL